MAGSVVVCKNQINSKSVIIISGYAKVVTSAMQSSNLNNNNKIIPNFYIVNCQRKPHPTVNEKGRVNLRKVA